MNDKPPEEWNTGARTRKTKAKYSDLRDNPIPLREKRSMREAHQTGSTRFWIPFTQNNCSCLRPAWAKSLQILATMKLWQKTLIAIRGKFGSSISSYFSFLRFLMLLNFLSFLLTTGLVIIPTAFLKGSTHRLHAPCGNLTYFPTRSFHALLDVFTGEGFMADTYLFYGHYSEMTGSDSSFNTQVAYLLTPLLFLSMCGLGLLQSTVKGITQRRIRTRDYRTPISMRVFAGWDFCVRGAGTSSLKQRSLSNDLKSHLAEECWYWKNSQMSVNERVRVLVLRVLLNCVILAMMAGGFYCIYAATGISQDYQQMSGSPVAGLVIQYLTPIAISLVLFILPRFFMLLVKFEGQSPRVEITLTLIRCVFLRLGVLGIFFFSLGQKFLCLGGRPAPCKTCGYNSEFKEILKALYFASDQHPLRKPDIWAKHVGKSIIYCCVADTCWETSLGQEFYKLSVFHFLQLVMEFLLVQLPRRFLVSRSQCNVVRWFGKEKFRLSRNVLDTVYSQTLVMGGMFYAPLLPLLNLIFIFITFYIKKYSLYRLCDVSKKLYRASTLRIIFCFVLLLGLITVFLPLIYLVTSVRPSHSCGPFAEYTTPWEAVKNSTRSALPPTVLTMLGYATSETSAYTLLFVLCLTLTSLASRVRQNEKDVDQLKDLLSNQIEDKEFLVRRLKETEDRQNRQNHDAEDEFQSL